MRCLQCEKRMKTIHRLHLLRSRLGASLCWQHLWFVEHTLDTFGHRRADYGFGYYGKCNAMLKIHKKLCSFLKNTLREWRNVYYISGAILVLGALVFLFLASGDVQPWATGKAKLVSR